LYARLARETYLDAFLLAAMFAGGLASGGGVREATESARAAPPSGQPRGMADLLLDGWATRFTDGYAEGLPILRRAVDAFVNSNVPGEGALRCFWLASTTAAHIWDYETWQLLSVRFVQLAREVGALSVLPLALNSLITAQVLAGELTEGASLLAEPRAATEATRVVSVPLGALLLAAWRGDDAQARPLIEATAEEAVRRGEGIGLTVAGWRRPARQQPRSVQGSVHRRTAGLRNPSVMGLSPDGVFVELSEAAMRSGNAEAAASALQQLSETTQASGTDWALGVKAYGRALVSQGPAAQDDYREAIERLGRTRVRGSTARAHLQEAKIADLVGEASPARRSVIGSSSAREPWNGT
jgi:hypothetical protein